MTERTFDFTAPIRQKHRLLYILMGVVYSMNGLIYFEKHRWLGILNLSLGLFVFFCGTLLKKGNRYLVTFTEAAVEIRRGLFSHSVLPWKTLSEVRIKLMEIEFHRKDGKTETFSFSSLEYNDVQTYKPQILSEVQTRAKAHNIPITTGHSSQTKSLEPDTVGITEAP
ncbi:MAG: hypothetical protein O2954_01000 [bacterium]|nr:hypothetical protein [bacterium]